MGFTIAEYSPRTRPPSIGIDIKRRSDHTAGIMMSLAPHQVERSTQKLAALTFDVVAKPLPFGNCSMVGRVWQVCPSWVHLI